MVTERIHGVSLNQIDRESSDLAHSNALDFIQGIVLPQLEQLRSAERGINGFVMPPSWLSPDVQPPWIGKKHWKTLPLKEPGYVFQHGDLAAHNIIMNPETLQVEALIDWEYAGFFPPGMQRWPGTLDQAVQDACSNNIASAVAKFLSEEYLECYKQWDNKEELNRLIESGQLPDPAALGQDREEE